VEVAVGDWCPELGGRQVEIAERPLGYDDCRRRDLLHIGEISQKRVESVAELAERHDA
jgi:hypothetical protein